MSSPIDADPFGEITAGRDLTHIAADFRTAAAPLAHPGATVAPAAQAAFTAAMADIHKCVAAWGAQCDRIGEAAKTTGRIVYWADDSSRIAAQHWPE